MSCMPSIGNQANLCITSTAELAAASHRSQARKAALERISGRVSGCLRRAGCLPLAAAAGAAAAWGTTPAAATLPASDVIAKRCCGQQTLQGEPPPAFKVVPGGGRSPRGSPSLPGSQRRDAKASSSTRQ